MSSTSATPSQRLDALRAKMRGAAIDLLLIPSADAHQSEYVPDAWQRRPWISGFTGSMGDCVVGLAGAWQWADSRYWLQGEAELDADAWTLMKDGAPGVPSIAAWLASAPEGTRLGVDPRCVPPATFQRLKDGLAAVGGSVVSLDDNLVDAVWEDQPALPSQPVLVWDDAFAGRDVATKLSDIRRAMTDSGVDALVVSTLDAVAWLFNVRGTDVPFNPYIIGYGLVTHDAATLFVDDPKVTAAARAHLDSAQVTTQAYGAFGPALEALSGTVQVDRDHASQWIIQRVVAGGSAVHAAASPVMMLKALKNPREQRGMRESHVRDGVAVCRFLHWLQAAWKTHAPLDEIGASDKLEAFRSEVEHFRGLSFDTISGFEANGAIVHYRASPETAKVIDDSAMYLLDSGGQYLDGTTDITRTLHLGSPSQDERRHYTLVLKGHLALGNMRFPKGTSGSQLDAMARGPLWQAGLNYGHGTGHGVGCFLGVHQGPQRISPAPNRVGLAPGMVVSNEPGFYQDGAYGIRIENLVLVVDAPASGEAGASKYGPFYAFEDLTMVPYCRKLIDVSMLSQTERSQLNSYHARVREALAGKLPADVQTWMEAESAPV